VITANVFNRIFLIRVGSDTGTAFTVEHDGKQYLVTAAHLLLNVKPPYQIELFHEKTWKDLELELTGISPVADIAVFAPSFQLSPAFNLLATTTGVVYGQDVFFFGFPYGMLAEVGPLNRDFPLPLVKKACLSALTDGPDGGRLIVLDGHNNPGFSGGPVAFSEQGKPFGSSFKIMGVISGYRFDEQPAFYEGVATPFTVRSNAGIIFAYDIKHAIEEIEKNPNGVVIEISQ
jgi:S1-C subfamily serine protease